MSPEKECLRLLECVDESQLLPWITRLLECLDESQLLPWITRRWIALWPDPPETVTRLMSLNYCIQHQKHSNLSTSGRATHTSRPRCTSRLDTPTPMPTASERACGFANLLYPSLKQCTNSPPFKLVEILFNFQCGTTHINSLTLIMALLIFRI